MNLLLVDDDADTRELVGMYLGRHGIKVHAVETLAAAKEALSSTPYAVLMTDLRLPDGDGRALLQSGRPPQLRFAVVVSGHASDQDREATLSAGFDAHLAKPLDGQTLKQLIAKFGTDSPPC
jgi:DNA-binding response OmpR family regulator